MILSRFVALSVSLSPKASLFQDWEFGDINATEQVMYAKFLVQFKRALPPSLRLSAAVGGFWKKSGTAPTKVAGTVDIPTLKGSDVVLYSMDTCKCLQRSLCVFLRAQRGGCTDDGEDDVFSRNIATGAANVGRPQPENWGVGLAWSSTSWPAPMCECSNGRLDCCRL